MAAPLVFEFSFALPERERPLEAGDALRLLVMGDFSGRANRAAHDPASLAARPIRRVDLDNFDQLMARMDVSLTLPLGEPATVAFQEIDDFHPDQLFRKLEVFRALASARSAPPPASAFADLLGAPAHPVKPAALNPVSEIDAIVRNIVGSIALADPSEPARKAAMEMALAAEMQKLLRQPDFRALEAGWRSLRQLLTSLDLDEELQLHVLDVSKEELAADLAQANGNLEQSALFRKLEGGWSALIGNYSFGPGAGDLAMLAALGALASHAGGPFVAGAEAGVLGIESFAAAPDARDWAAPPEAWQALRTSTHAGWIGLVAPRLLLRLPYGKASDPIERFAFEEADHPPRHQDYVWGNGAFAWAELLGRAYAANGWDMRPGDVRDIDDLPAHTYRLDGNPHMQACAEAYLGERAADALLERGLMPLASFKDRNAVRLLRSQSVALPPQALNGVWNSR